MNSRAERNVHPEERSRTAPTPTQKTKRCISKVIKMQQGTKYILGEQEAWWSWLGRKLQLTMSHVRGGMEDRCQRQLPPCAWPGHLQLPDVCGAGVCVQSPPRQAPRSAHLPAHTGSPTLVVPLLQPTMGQLQG